MTSPTIQPPRRPLTQRPLAALRRALDSRLARALSYPHDVDHYLELVSPSWSLRRVRARVVEVVRETPDVVTLWLQPNALFRGHQAGQYVALTVEVDGVRHTRCFSFSSAPARADGRVALTVKARASGGLVSPFLVSRAEPGLQVELSQALGDFVLPDALPGRLLFLSGGSGITPCMSMLRALLSGGYRGQVVFVHYARSPEDVIFARELRALSRRHTNLRLVIETESELGRPPSLDHASLSAHAPDYDAWDAWVCGPAPLMDAAHALYGARGAGARLRSERFVEASQAVAPDAPTGALHFARSRVRVQGQGKNLLEQAEAAGLRPRSGCRMGICQSCRCRKLSGVTQDLRTGELASEDVTSIRLCVSAPVGDVSLDL